MNRNILESIYRKQISHEEDFSCKEIIDEVQKKLKLQHIQIIYDHPNDIIESLKKGAHIVYLSVIDDIGEREKYKKKTDILKARYKTKSARIHFPDTSAKGIAFVYQCGLEDEFERVTLLLNKEKLLKNAEEDFVRFLFLHEVGHWNQLHRMDRLVKAYIEKDAELERKIFNSQNKIIDYAMKRNGVSSLGGDINLTEEELNALNELQNEYRAIPKEAEADEFAISMISKL